jgi:dihydroorotase
LPLYAAVFEEEGALDQLEGFASRFGPAFYGLPVSDRTLTLAKGEPYAVPLVDQAAGVRVFQGGEQLAWRVVS